MRQFATLAQLVEQLIRNQQVTGSSPVGGSFGGIMKYESAAAENYEVGAD
jgi:hypothetical protein